jgi:hypothetical protein
VSRDPFGAKRTSAERHAFAIVYLDRVAEPGRLLLRRPTLEERLTCQWAAG